MRRSLLFILCAVASLVMLLGGLLVPAHLRSVDQGLLQHAGDMSPGLVEKGLALVREGNTGAAGLLLQAAQAERVPDRDTLRGAVAEAERREPGLQKWGCREPILDQLFPAGTKPLSDEPFTGFIVQEDHRKRVLDWARSSTHPLAKELLRCRTLKHTTIFAPSESASGQAFDAALSTGVLLSETGRMRPELRDTVLALATGANHGADSQRLEQVLLDLLSLGQRFDWGQLEEIVGTIRDTDTLRQLSHLVRNAGLHLPVIFAAVELSSDAAGVSSYLFKFSQTGMKDLSASVRYGGASVTELLQRKERVSVSSLQPLAGSAPLTGFCRFMADYAWRSPGPALVLKWLFYLAGGFLLATAVHVARPAVSFLEQNLQVRGFHIARESLFALGFLVVVLLLSEPFLAQESQKAQFPFRLRLPMVGNAVSAGNAPATTTIMNTLSLNQLSLLTLLLFFILQALLYTACLVKLAEIRRQRVAARIKLKLLENEEHLFDAGLYLGFAGTIISLILVSLNVIQPSLMAAYSSTSFGIIFVSIFKIFHLRPARRKLLLEAMTGSVEAEERQAAAEFAMSS